MSVTGGGGTIQPIYDPNGPSSPVPNPNQPSSGSGGSYSPQSGATVPLSGGTTGGGGLSLGGYNPPNMTVTGGSSGGQNLGQINGGITQGGLGQTNAVNPMGGPLQLRTLPDGSVQQLGTNGQWFPYQPAPSSSATGPTAQQQAALAALQASNMGQHPPGAQVQTSPSPTASASATSNPVTNVTYNVAPQNRPQQLAAIQSLAGGQPPPKLDFALPGPVNFSQPQPVEARDLGHPSFNLTALGGPGGRGDYDVQAALTGVGKTPEGAMLGNSGERIGQGPGQYAGQNNAGFDYNPSEPTLQRNAGLNIGGAGAVSATKPQYEGVPQGMQSYPNVKEFPDQVPAPYGASISLNDVPEQYRGGSNWNLGQKWTNISGQGWTPEGWNPSYGPKPELPFALRRKYMQLWANKFGAPSGGGASTAKPQEKPKQSEQAAPSKPSWMGYNPSEGGGGDSMNVGGENAVNPNKPQYEGVPNDPGKNAENLFGDLGKMVQDNINKSANSAIESVRKAAHLPEHKAPEAIKPPSSRPQAKPEKNPVPPFFTPPALPEKTQAQAQKAESTFLDDMTKTPPSAEMPPTAPEVPLQGESGIMPPKAPEHSDWVEPDEAEAQAYQAQLHRTENMPEPDSLVVARVNADRARINYQSAVQQFSQYANNDPAANRQQAWESASMAAQPLRDAQKDYENAKNAYTRIASQGDVNPYTLKAYATSVAQAKDRVEEAAQKWEPLSKALHDAYKGSFNLGKLMVDSARNGITPREQLDKDAEQFALQRLPKFAHSPGVFTPEEYIAGRPVSRLEQVHSVPSALKQGLSAIFNKDQKMSQLPNPEDPLAQHYRREFEDAKNEYKKGIAEEGKNLDANQKIVAEQYRNIVDDAKTAWDAASNDYTAKKDEFNALKDRQQKIAEDIEKSRKELRANQRKDDTKAQGDIRLEMAAQKMQNQVNQYNQKQADAWAKMQLQEAGKNQRFMATLNQRVQQYNQKTNDSNSKFFTKLRQTADLAERRALVQDRRNELAKERLNLQEKFTDKRMEQMDRLMLWHAIGSVDRTIQVITRAGEAIMKFTHP